MFFRSLSILCFKKLALFLLYKNSVTEIIINEMEIKTNSRLGRKTIKTIARLIRVIASKS